MSRPTITAITISSVRQKNKKNITPLRVGKEGSQEVVILELSLAS